MKNLLGRIGRTMQKSLGVLRSMVAPAYIIVGLAVATGALYLYQVDQTGDNTASGLKRETLCNTQWKDQFTLAQGERLAASNMTTEKLRAFYLELQPVTASILKSFETGRQEVSREDADALFRANEDIIEFMDAQAKVQNKFPYPDSRCPPQPSKITQPGTNPTPSPSTSPEE